jgi:hypothetical protein
MSGAFAGQLTLTAHPATADISGEHDGGMAINRSAGAPAVANAPSTE